ncbi:MAG: AI-2E family transporter [Endomicrobium sp.]|jgi:predicted PurR-regulated permease PerM|nr:AI-2E family transporter [Endomicrobium sp.]
MLESSKNRIFIIAVLIFLAICLFLYFARGILAPFFIAAFIAYLISPLVLKIQSYGYKRWVGIAIIVIIFLSAVAAFLIVFIPPLIAEIEKFKVSASDYYAYFASYLDIIKSKIEVAVPAIKHYNIADIVVGKIHSFIFSKAQQIPTYIMSVFSIFSILVLIPMLIIFMLFGGNKSINKAVNFLPSKYIETILSVIYEINSVLGKFIRGQLIEAFFVGIISVIFLSVLGVNFALIIGAIAGFANMVPCLGPFVGLFLALIVGIIQFQTFMIAIKIVVAYAIIQFLDNNFVQPFVIGRSLNLGSIATIFALLAGGQIFGFFGIIFAVPVMAIFKTTFIMLVHKYRRLY